MPSVFGCIPSGSRYGNGPNELVHRAGPPFLDNHYRGYQLLDYWCFYFLANVLAFHVKVGTYLCDCGYKINYATKETRLHGSEIVCEGKKNLYRK